MFTYPILKCNAMTAIETPLDIPSSKKMAQDFFGSAGEASGKIVRYQNRKDLKVTAVFDDVPKNSSAQFDYIINWQTFLENNNWAKDWTNNGPPCYIMLRQGTDPLAFNKKITRFLDNYNNEQPTNAYVRLGV